MSDVKGDRPARVVAIDGPSGSGKSTVAREVARRLGWRYLDTGAMYRAVTWLALERGIDVGDAPPLTRLAETTTMSVATSPDEPRIVIDGHDVTIAIRGAEVTAAVSAVSAVPGVRSALLTRQRELIGDGRIVVEGRDIGTVVAPDATVKVFLTASGDARALRRAKEEGRDEQAHVATTKVQLEQRDAHDAGRAAAPLVRARDAHEIDSTTLTADAVVERILSLLPANVGAR